MNSETEKSGEPKVRAKAAPKARKSAAKTSAAADASAKSKTPGAKKKAPGSKTKTPATKARKPKAKPAPNPAPNPVSGPASGPAAGYMIGDPVLDPIGDVSSGEARILAGEPAAPEARAEMAAYRAETEVEAADGTLEARPGDSTARAEAELVARAQLAADESDTSSAETGEDATGEDEAGTGQETEQEPGPAAKLERLQKILSQAGVASRRRAEEMIVAGRVMVNGQIVTQLGSKADPARDHIRVDGKLLHGAERHRYFILNKPKGYVTTVSDPEGRPTVMEFFTKMRERLYPVGRLDYQSEGLLLMTNDGELANRLSKAGSGVEKTYVVKVAGQPSEEDLERLRGGVAIERGQADSRRVRTAPARIRQIREGDNPWYEVVLIEGRNRELRKMFAAVGHFVEKIRRVGYGPLVLDVEPGEFRELTVGEAAALRLAAEGKLQPRPAKQALAREGKSPQKKHGPRERSEWEPREQRFATPRTKTDPRGPRFATPRTKTDPRGPRFGGNAEDRQPQRSAKPGLRRPQGEWANASSKPGQPRGEQFGGRSGFAAPEKERAAAKTGRFGARPGGRKPFGGRPEFEAGPGTRFERGRFAGRPRQRDEQSGIEESPRRAFRRHGERQDRAEKHGAQKFARPAKPFSQAAGKRFGAGPGKSPAGKPEGRWNQAAGKRTDRWEGSAPEFRGKGKPSAADQPAAGSRMEPEGRAKPSFGAKSSFRRKPGGFSQSGGKGRSGSAGRSGPRPPGKPWGGKRRG